MSASRGLSCFNAARTARVSLLGGRTFEEAYSPIGTVHFPVGNVRCPFGMKKCAKHTFCVQPFQGSAHFLGKCKSHHFEARTIRAYSPIRGGVRGSTIPKGDSADLRGLFLSKVLHSLDQVFLFLNTVIFDMPFSKSFFICTPLQKSYTK